MVMMMIAPNSLARLKEWVQGEDEEEVRDTEREAKLELRRQVRMLPKVHFGQRRWMRGTSKMMVWGSTQQEGQRGQEIRPLFS